MKKLDIIDISYLILYIISNIIGIVIFVNSIGWNIIRFELFYYFAGYILMWLVGTALFVLFYCLSKMSESIFNRGFIQDKKER